MWSTEEKFLVIIHAYQNIFIINLLCIELQSAAPVSEIMFFTFTSGQKLRGKCNEQSGEAASWLVQV